MLFPSSPGLHNHIQYINQSIHQSADFRTSLGESPCRPAEHNSPWFPPQSLQGNEGQLPQIQYIAPRYGTVRLAWSLTGLVQAPGGPLEHDLPVFADRCGTLHARALCTTETPRSAPWVMLQDGATRRNFHARRHKARRARMWALACATSWVVRERVYMPPSPAEPLHGGDAPEEPQSLREA